MHAQFGFGKPPSDPDDAPYNPEDHTSRSQDAEDVSGQLPTAFIRIEERVGVEAGGHMGKVGQSEVQRQQDNEEREMCRGRRRGPCQEDLASREDCIQRMLRCLQSRQLSGLRCHQVKTGLGMTVHSTIPGSW